MDDSDAEDYFSYIVVGGGISGVTCAETLAALDSSCKILLLSASPLIKAVTNFQQVSKTLESFDVEERPLCELAASCENVKVMHSVVTSFHPSTQELTTSENQTFRYKKLCLCTGGSPRIIAKNNPYVIGIRDTETVKVFQKRLEKARRVIVVGNGGIATEVVYETEGCEVLWAIKDKSITSTFVDAGAATFFLPQLNSEKQPNEGPLKRRKYTHVHPNETQAESSGTNSTGSALGPDWSEGLPMRGSTELRRAVHVEYQVEVRRVLTPGDVKEEGLHLDQPPRTKLENIEDWPVFVELTNGKIFGCDFVVSATGVVPHIEPFVNFAEFDISDEGGIKVNDKMQTSVADVYASGDVCTTSWKSAPHWFQMRLWTQARQMGAYAAKCMVADVKGELDDLFMDFCFELFAHVTKFFNYKVVLLGKFNAQGLGTDHELLLRVTKGMEYVKAVMQDGRMQGAILIGETDLEETFENLILNQTDLSRYGEELLDPNIDIEDYFD